jgi:hypothetical protein
MVSIFKLVLGNMTSTYEGDVALVRVDGWWFIDRDRKILLTNGSRISRGVRVADETLFRAHGTLRVRSDPGWTHEGYWLKEAV